MRHGRAGSGRAYAGGVLGAPHTSTQAININGAGPGERGLA